MNKKRVVFAIVLFIVFGLFAYTFANPRNNNNENTNNGEKLKQAAVLLAKARIAAHNVPLSIVQLGIVGMNFSKSSVDEENVELVVSYKVVLPVSYFGRREMSFSQRALAHRWVGFDPKDGIGGEVDGDSVYVTATGSAYHKSLSCSYLNPSIRPVSLSSVSSMRTLSSFICAISSEVVPDIPFNIR